jgi:hypothetical protein
MSSVEIAVAAEKSGHSLCDAGAVGGCEQLRERRTVSPQEGSVRLLRHAGEAQPRDDGAPRAAEDARLPAGRQVLRPHCRTLHAAGWS